MEGLNGLFHLVSSFFLCLLDGLSLLLEQGQEHTKGFRTNLIAVLHLQQVNGLDPGGNIPQGGQVAAQVAVKYIAFFIYPIAYLVPNEAVKSAQFFEMLPS